MILQRLLAAPPSNATGPKLMSLGAWTSLAIVFTVHAMIPSPAAQDAGEWMRAAAWQLAGWWSWAVCTPIVVAAVRRVPVAESPNRFLAAHLAIGVALSGACTALQGSVRWLAFPGFRDRYDLTDASAASLADAWAFNLVVYLMVVGLVHLRHGRREPSTLERIGDLTVDYHSHEVRRGGRLIDLRPKEYALLVALLKRSGAIATRDELLREVWGYSEDVTSRTVDVHVAALRKRIETDPSRPRFVRTVRHHGYRLTRGDDANA